MTAVPKRVCYVIRSLDVGGAPIQLLRLLRELARDHELTVVCTGKAGSLRAEAERLGAVVHEAGLSVSWDPRTTRRLVGLFRNHRPDVVHSMLQGMDWFACRAAQLTGVPVAVSSRREMADQLTPRQLRWQRRANQLVDAIVANSQAVATDAIKHEQAPPSLFRIIPNGVDTTLPEPDEPFELPFPKGAPVIGMVANFVPVKDHALFLQMARILAAARKDLCFLLVGRGPLRAKVVQDIAESGMADRFHVAQTARATAATYRAMARLVLTSRSEGCPNAIMEAMAVKVPVIAGAVGGVPELIADGVTGRLVRSRDPEDFAAAVLASIEDSDAPAMAARAQEMVRDERSVERMAAAHRRLYAELLAEAHRKAT